MSAQRYEVLESIPIGPDKNKCTVFISDLAALGDIPKSIVDTMVSGSVAYTMAPIVIYHRDGGNWLDANGTVVG